jgi:putative Ca2+/H+ antiporter (TMEM165/GDT1 family)
MTRVLCTKSFATTYSTNDTAVFTGIATASGDYTLCEFGLHTAITAGNMGARQTSCTWDVVNGETFGMIWRIVASRG